MFLAIIIIFNYRLIIIQDKEKHKKLLEEKYKLLREDNDNVVEYKSNSKNTLKNHHFYTWYHMSLSVVICLLFL